MTSLESLRNVLEQVHTTARDRRDAGGLSDDELDELNSFAEGVEKLVLKLSAQDPAIPKRNLFGDLMQLHGRCTGPLEPYRGGMEKALSVVETLTH